MKWNYSFEWENSLIDKELKTFHFFFTDKIKYEIETDGIGGVYFVSRCIFLKKVKLVDFKVVLNYSL